MGEMTYSFCFFLGPGLPLGFGTPSCPSAPAPLFAPGRGPGTPFRLPFAWGGARVLDGVLAPLTGAGVAADSTGVSAAGDGSMTWATGASEADEVDLDDDFADGSAATWGNLTRWSGDSLRTAIRDLVAFVAISVTAARVVVG